MLCGIQESELADHFYVHLRSKPRKNIRTASPARLIFVKHESDLPHRPNRVYYVGDESLFAPFAKVHIADSTGFELPASLRDAFPGAGGNAAPAGAKIQLVWEYKSSTFAHFALTPWNIPDNKYIATVVALAQKGSLFLFDLGYFKTAAFAQIAAAHAYFLSRLNHQTTLYTAGAGYRKAKNCK